MIDRILTVTEKDGRPVVPGASMVIPCADGWYKAVGNPVPNPSGRGATLPAIARLYRDAPGKYFVEADETLISKMDAQAKTPEEFALSPAASVWTCKDEIDQSIRAPSGMVGCSIPVRRVKPVVVEDVKVVPVEIREITP